LDRFGNYIRDAAVSFEPSEGDLLFPLTVGSSWRIERKERLSDSSPAVHVLGEAKVVGYGKVHTAAGEFDAFEIDAVSSTSYEDSPWHGTWHITTWYAPQVHRMVKREAEYANVRARLSWHLEISSYGHFEIINETMGPEAASAAAGDLPSAIRAASDAGAGGGQAGSSASVPTSTRRRVGHC
jgi:hypothetical protein